MVHHLMSDRASELMRMISRCFRLASVNNEMSLPTNDLPGLTTLDAWLRCPSRDSLEHTFLNCHSARRSLSQLSLSLGNLSFIARVSISIPKNVRQVVGQTDLCAASGTPSSLHVAIMICWFRAHWSELGGPIVMKSSR